MHSIRLNFELKKSPSTETQFMRTEPVTAQSRLLNETGAEQMKQSSVASAFENQEDMSWDQLEELAKKHDESKMSAKTPKRLIRSASQTANRRKCELFRKANNHSFKEISLTKIESYLEPTSLKDPVEYLNNHVPTLNTKYTVSVLKKPFSMKWLRSRRLALFLQSDFYNEFKLAYLLAQCAVYNYNSTAADRKMTTLEKCVENDFYLLFILYYLSE